MTPEEHTPKEFPAPGFYYHYKSAALPNPEDHAYEVVGTGFHTETSEYSVLYRPVHRDSWGYINGKVTFVRPLEMFMGTVVVEGVEMPRFIPITDPETIQKLRATAAEMYGA